MKDNEIVKALEKVLATGDAPVGEHWGCSVTTKLAKETFDMLKRQNAEINRYKKTVGTLATKEDGTVIGTLIGNKTEYIPKKLHKTFKNMAVRRAIKDIYRTLEAEAVSSDKYIREYDDSTEQKAYNQALWYACKLVKEELEDKYKCQIVKD